jgi:GTP-binding protein EngB required for normal cell division
VEKESEESSSVPLLIVGNKIDKLNAHEKLALQNACPQQVFVVSRESFFVIISASHVRLSKIPNTVSFYFCSLPDQSMSTTLHHFINSLMR